MSAVFVGDANEYRVRLDRKIADSGIVVALCGVNPSIAGAKTDDQTIRKDVGFGQRLGWSRIIKVNKFSHVATDVAQLAKVNDPVGSFNDEYLAAAFAEADLIVPCWGSLGKLPPRLRDRWREVLDLMVASQKPVLCFGTCADGHPRHTLTLPYSTPLEAWLKWLMA
jgi:hypothetical protein